MVVKPVGKAQIDVLLAASIPLRYRPKVAAGGLLVVPERERARLEKTIEYVANMVAVTEACSRSITSPYPCVALRAGDDATREWLNNLGGILGASRLREIPAFSSPISLSETGLQNILGARRDGVALLAEAYAQGHGLGRYRDLIRLFERAFALPASKVGPALTAFLDARYGYTEHEVAVWLTIRDPATHADMRDNFALEPDVFPILERMEQAARDVLLNKAEWRSPTLDRHYGWSPRRGHAPKTVAASFGRERKAASRRG